MSRFNLSRRTFLRGAVGTGVAVGLCPLDAMFDGNGEAYAQGMPLSRRLGVVYIGNGTPGDLYIHETGDFFRASWVPPALGAGFPLSPCLAPLAGVKQHVRVMSGLWAPSAGTIPFGHLQPKMYTMAGSIKLAPYWDDGIDHQSFPGASLDYTAAKTLSAGARFNLLPVGVCTELDWPGSRVNEALTFDDNGDAVPSEFSPRAVFDKLFLGWTPPSMAPPPPDPAVLRKRSILDAVSSDAKRLQRRLGATDRQRIDKHLTQIRELERSLPDPSQTASAAGPSCAVPPVPAAATDYPTIANQMVELIGLAFACDQTRVVSFQISKTGGMATFPWLGVNLQHHTAGHVSGSTREEWAERTTKIAAWHFEVFANLVAKLRDTPEGAGSVLDNSLLFTLGDDGNSENHDHDDLPIVVAGGPSLVRGDYHWRGGGGVFDRDAGPSVASFSLAALQAVGVPVSSFGPATSPVPLK